MSENPSSNSDNVLAFQWQPWNEFATVASLLMECVWIALWYRVITGTVTDTSLYTTYLVLGILLVSTYFLVFLLNGLQLKTSIQRGALVVWLITWYLLTLNWLVYAHSESGLVSNILSSLGSLADPGFRFPAEIGNSIFVIWIIYRGLAIHHNMASLDGIRNGFIIGGFLIGAYGFTGFSNLRDAWLSVLVFLLCGLLAMSAVRIHSLRYLRGGRSVPFTRAWLASITTAVLAVIGLTVIATGVIFWKVGEWLASALGFIWNLVLLFIGLLLLPFVAIMSQSNPAFSRMADQLSQARNTISKLIENLRYLINRLLAYLDDIFFPLGGINFWSILLIIIVILAFIAFIRYIRLKIRQRRSSVQEEEEEGDSNLSESISQFLRNGLESILALFNPTKSWRNPRRLLAMARIRRIYTQLMQLSESLGKTRQAAITPFEFLPVLNSLFPAHESDLHTITEAYVRVRYGEIPEDPAELEEVETAWKRVSNAGNEKRRQLKKERSAGKLPG